MALSYPILELRPPAYHQGCSYHLKRVNCNAGIKSSFVFQNKRSRISCAISMSDGQFGDNEKINLARIMDKAAKFWEDLPHPVKSFPWNRVQDNFIQFILDTVVAVIKYLSAPLLAVSALSELSYCAHERKLFLVPIPLLLGFVFAGLLKEAALELSPVMKGTEVPWHLIAIAIFSIFLKLPGPYFPYWGRFFVPHFANGVLLRVFWMIYCWYRRPKKPTNDELEQDLDSLEQNGF